MYIVYGGLSADNEVYSIKLKLSIIESLVLRKPPQNHILNVTINFKKRQP